MVPGSSGVLKDCITNPDYEKMHFVEILMFCTIIIVKNYTDDDDIFIAPL